MLKPRVVRPAWAAFCLSDLARRVNENQRVRMRRRAPQQKLRLLENQRISGIAAISRLEATCRASKKHHRSAELASYWLDMPEQLGAGFLAVCLWGDVWVCLGFVFAGGEGDGQFGFLVGLCVMLAGFGE
jgi:hypothetical protein